MSIIRANVSDLYISSNFTDCLPELSACDISYTNMCELRGLGLKLWPGAALSLVACRTGDETAETPGTWCMRK